MRTVLAQSLPYNTALKYTVAKYYTPSGRCIQSTEYRGAGKQDTPMAAANTGAYLSC